MPVWARKDNCKTPRYYGYVDGKKRSYGTNKAIAERVHVEDLARARRVELGLEIPRDRIVEPTAFDFATSAIEELKATLSKRTIAVFESSRNALFGTDGFFGNSKLSQITEEDVSRYVRSCQENGQKPATIQLRLRYLKHFGKLAVERKLLHAGQAPVKKELAKYLPKQLKEELSLPTDKQYEQVIATCQDRIRNFLIILRNSGLRIRELAYAKVGWVVQIEGRTFLRLPADATKTRTARTALVLSTGLQALQAQLEQAGKGPEAPLFPDEPEALVHCVQDRLARLVRKLEFKNKFVAHSLRGMYVSQLCLMGVPPTVIGRFTGQTLPVIQHYAKHNMSDLGSILDKMEAS